MIITKKESLSTSSGLFKSFPHTQNDQTGVEIRDLVLSRHFQAGRTVTRVKEFLAGEEGGEILSENKDYI